MTMRSRVLFFPACTVLLIVACSFAGCSSSPGPAGTAGTPTAAAPLPDTITIRNFAFSPAALTIKPETTVTWINDDGAPHTVVSDAGAPAAFTSPSLANGASYRFTFGQSGTYTYHCSIHPSMKGTITVQP